MMVRLMTLVTVAVGILAIWMAFTQQSAYVLRKENQDQHWSHSELRVSGYYSSTSGRWQYSSREGFTNFQGGGPGAGK